MPLFKADLHLHTCLSPCGGFDVTPAAVVARAAQLGLDIIAICDHNSVENLPAALVAARRLGAAAPLVLPGLEVTSAEEAHLVALFGGLTQALTFQGMVYDHLQPGQNNPDVFGMQIVANADDEVEEFNPRLLIGATDLGAAELVERIHSLEGLAVAAHLDRPAYSLVGQLGLIPPELTLDGAEISARQDPAQAQKWLAGRELAVLTSSDAHELDRVGAVWSELELASASLAEIGLALKGREGRRVAGWGRRNQEA
ncbi:MAG: PHP domain-containing protein [Desulfarculus sp.]|nr:MAG: PHP domain-containing protein [Desulfarculus sp.]